MLGNYFVAVMKFFTISLLVLTIFLIGKIVAYSQTSPQQLIEVTLCALAQRPEQYDKKIVRLSAIYVMSYHGAYLYDPQCSHPDSTINVDSEKSKIYRTSKNVRRKFKEIAKNPENDKASVVVIGRFNDWRGFGYGHLGFSRFQFDAMKFESVNLVTNKIAAHSKDENPDSFMNTVKFILDNLDSNYNIAYLNNDAMALNAILPDDFILTTAQNKKLTKSEFLKLAEQSKPNIRKGTTISLGGGKIDLRLDKSVVTGQVKIESCEQTIEQYNYTNIYFKRNGQWKITSSTISNVFVMKLSEIKGCDEK